MSGDVFGNGMLLSKAIKLVAAFDHRHIFLDPDPDPAKSWEERKRLFDLPRSSWDDYDKSLISKGGGVFPRSQKSIPLSPEVRAMLGIEAEEIEPADADHRDPRRRRSTCSGSAASAPTSRPRARATPRSAIPATTRSGSTAPSFAPRRSARAPTSPSPRPAGSSSPSAAGGSTPTSSTIRPASTARTTRSTSRSR